MLTIGLDVGTQGTKALIHDSNNNCILGRGAVSYGLISTRKGQAEQEPLVWVQACRDAIAQALQSCDEEQKSSVCGLAVSGQQHGMVVLDKFNAVIRPAKLWCDLESADEAIELSEFFKTTLVPSFTMTKILWLKRHEPENYARVARVLLPKDFINFWLTGQFTMEPSDASGTGLLDPIQRTRWDAARIAAVDPALAAWLPSELLPPGAPAGTLLPEVAAELGLRSGIVVGPGGGDNAMSALGVGAVRPGVWVASLGTSGTLFGPSERPVLDPSGAICAFCDATDKYLPLLCTVNCTGATEEVRRSCGLSHDELAELADAEAPGCEGATFLPYFAGERTPNWPHATAALLGLRPGMMRPGLVYRSAMEGATFSLLAGMQKLNSELRGSHEEGAVELRVVGGGSKSKVWRQIIADAFQIPLRFPVESETAALGAALQAGAIASGIPVAEFVESHSPQLEAATVQPNRDAAAAYSEAFDRFVRLGVALFGADGIFCAPTPS